MRLTAGQKAPQVKLYGIDGREFDTHTLSGRPFLLSFFRFAGCPFCNLRIHELVKAYPELSKQMELVAVFDSPLKNLQRHMSKHQAPFPILADETNECYQTYGIERSLMGVFRALIRRIPALTKSVLMGNIPKAVQGRMTTMPAEFLVNADGVIEIAYYGKDEGDHIPLSEVRSVVDEATSP